MKQTLEEAAREAAEDCYEMPYDEKLINMKLVKEAFKYGAKWQSKQSPWISVEDRLPNNDDDLYFVLDVKLEPPACGICDFDLDMHKWVSAGGVILHPTHWMPIPSFDEILEANRDVLDRIKEKGD